MPRRKEPNPEQSPTIDAFTQEQRYREFAQQYIADFNAVAALRRCNWFKKAKRDGESPSSSDLLASIQVQGYIRELVEERRRRLDVSADAVLLEQARIAFSDVKNYWEWTSQGIRLKDSGLIDENASRAIESLEITEREMMSGITIRKTRIKMHNKASALESLAKNLGMYTEKHEVDLKYGTVAVPATASPKDWMEVIRQEIAHVSDNGTTTTNLESE